MAAQVETKLRLTAQDSTNTAFQSAAQEIERFTQRVGRAHKDLASQQTTAFQQISQVGERTFSTLAKLGALAGVAIGVETVREGVTELGKLDKQFIRLGITSKKSREEIEANDEAVKNFARNAGISVDGLRDSFAELERVHGFEGAQKGLKDVAQTASATGASLEQTTQFFNALTNNMHLNIDQFGAAADMVEGIANKQGNRIRGGELLHGLAEVSEAVTNLTHKSGLESLAIAASMMETFGKKAVTSGQAVANLGEFLDNVRSKGKGLQGFEKYYGPGALERSMMAASIGHKDQIAKFLQVTDETLRNMAARIGKRPDQRFDLLLQLIPTKADLRNSIQALIEERDSMLAEEGEAGRGKFLGTIDEEAAKVAKGVDASLTRLSNAWHNTKEELAKSLVSAGVVRGIEDFNQLLGLLSDALNGVGAAAGFVEDKMIGPNTAFGKLLSIISPMNALLAAHEKLKGGVEAPGAATSGGGESDAYGSLYRPPRAMSPASDMQRRAFEKGSPPAAGGWHNMHGKFSDFGEALPSAVRPLIPDAPGSATERTARDQLAATQRLIELLQPGGGGSGGAGSGVGGGPGGGSPGVRGGSTGGGRFSQGPQGSGGGRGVFGAGADGGGGGAAGGQPGGGEYNVSKAYDLIKKAGGSDEEARTLAAISQAESSGNPGAHNTKGRDNSYGLWQINMLGGMGPERRAKYGLKSNEDLFDPATNARVALAMHRAGGGYKDWSTYSSGAYKRYLSSGGGGGSSGGAGATGGAAADSNISTSGGAATRSDSISGMQPEFRSRLAAMMRDAPGGASVFSGYRSEALQDQLRRGPHRPGYVAMGTSHHTMGDAADIKGNLPWFHKHAAEYGLRFPMSYENWHIQSDPNTKVPVPGSSGGAVTAAPEQPSGDAARAADFAESMDGMKDHDPAGHAKIQEFLRTGGAGMDPATKDWCAGFVSAAYRKAGIKVPKNSGVATSWLNAPGWKKIAGADVRRGDAIITARGKKPGERGGHLAIASGGMDSTTHIINTAEGDIRVDKESYANQPRSDAYKGEHMSQKSFVSGTDPELEFRRPPGGDAVDKHLAEINAIRRKASQPIHTKIKFESDSHFERTRGAAQARRSYGKETTEARRRSYSDVGVC